jgi:hypothetical protein
MSPGTPLRRDPETAFTAQTETHIQKTVDYLRDRLAGRGLDVGQRSPMTAALERACFMKIDSTTGDLDLDFTILGDKYDFIVYSHTIEHQFSPLWTLLKLRLRLADSGIMFIALPDRGKLLWARGHFHEIDAYRFGLLMQRAGFRIVSKVRHKVWRPWWNYLLGFRAFYRLFREWNVIYRVEKIK